MTCESSAKLGSIAVINLSYSTDHLKRQSDRNLILQTIYILRRVHVREQDLRSSDAQNVSAVARNSVRILNGLLAAEKEITTSSSAVDGSGHPRSNAGDPSQMRRVVERILVGVSISNRSNRYQGIAPRSPLDSLRQSEQNGTGPSLASAIPPPTSSAPTFNLPLDPTLLDFDLSTDNEAWGMDIPAASDTLFFPSVPDDGAAIDLERLLGFLE